jgi:hypothetical protein
MLSQLLLNPQQHDRIRLMYKISKSTYHRLMKEKSGIVKDALRNVEEADPCEKERDLEKEEISNIVSPPTFPLTIGTINKRLGVKFGEKDRKYFIAKYLKDELRYSFKKGSKATIKSVTEKNKILRAIFSVQALQQIYRGKILINVDE